MIVFFMNWALEYRIEGETKGSFSLMLKGLLISLLVIIINCVTRLVVLSIQFRSKFLPSLRNITAIPNIRDLFAYTILSFIY